MSNFKFLGCNCISTSTFGLKIDNTYTSDYTFSSLVDRNRYNPFVWSTPAAHSTGAGDKIIYTFSSIVTNTLIIQNCNFKNFSVYINNSLTVLTVGNTTTATWTNFSDENLFIQWATIAATTILEIIVLSTTSGGDREIGQLMLCNERYELPNNPNFSEYNPLIGGKRLLKQMSDDGISVFDISQKFSCEIGLKYVPSSVTAELLNIYNTSSSFNFIPFSTITSWDGDVWNVNWINDYEFKKNSYNIRSNPLYNGIIKLSETPS